MLKKNTNTNTNTNTNYDIFIKQQNIFKINTWKISIKNSWFLWR